MSQAIRRNSTRTARAMSAIHASLRYGWATLPMIAAYVVVVWTTLMWFEPSPVERYYRTVSKLTVFPGEEIEIRSEVVRSKGGCASTVRRKWLDADLKLIVETRFEIARLPEGPERYVGPAIIPPVAKPGALWLITDVEFRCNLVQAALGGTHFPLPDILFNVVPRTLGSSGVAKASEEVYAGSYP